MLLSSLKSEESIIIYEDVSIIDFLSDHKTQKSNGNVLHVDLLDVEFQKEKLLIVFQKTDSDFIKKYSGNDISFGTNSLVSLYLDGFDEGDYIVYILNDLKLVGSIKSKISISQKKNQSVSAFLLNEHPVEGLPAEFLIDSSNQPNVDIDISINGPVQEKPFILNYSKCLYYCYFIPESHGIYTINFKKSGEILKESIFSIFVKEYDDHAFKRPFPLNVSAYCENNFSGKIIPYVFNFRSRKEVKKMIDLEETDLLKVELISNHGNEFLEPKLTNGGNILYEYYFKQHGLYLINTNIIKSNGKTIRLLPQPLLVENNVAYVGIKYVYTALKFKAINILGVESNGSLLKRMEYSDDDSEESEDFSDISESIEANTDDEVVIENSPEALYSPAQSNTISKVSYVSIQPEEFYVLVGSTISCCTKFKFRSILAPKELRTGYCNEKCIQRFDETEFSSYKFSLYDAFSTSCLFKDYNKNNIISIHFTPQTSGIYKLKAYNNDVPHKSTPILIYVFIDSRKATFKKYIHMISPRKSSLKNISVVCYNSLGQTFKDISFRIINNEEYPEKMIEVIYASSVQGFYCFRVYSEDKMLDTKRSNYGVRYSDEVDRISGESTSLVLPLNLSAIEKNKPTELKIKVEVIDSESDLKEIIPAKITINESNERIKLEFIPNIEGLLKLKSNDKNNNIIKDSYMICVKPKSYDKITIKDAANYECSENLFIYLSELDGLNWYEDNELSGLSVSFADVFPSTICAKIYCDQNNRLGFYLPNGIGNQFYNYILKRQEDLIPGSSSILCVCQIGTNGQIVPHENFMNDREAIMLSEIGQTNRQNKLGVYRFENTIDTIPRKNYLFIRQPKTKNYRIMALIKDITISSSDELMLENGKNFKIKSKYVYENENLVVIEIGVEYGGSYKITLGNYYTYSHDIELNLKKDNQIIETLINKPIELSIDLPYFVTTQNKKSISLNDVDVIAVHDENMLELIPSDLQVCENLLKIWVELKSAGRYDIGIFPKDATSGVCVVNQVICHADISQK